MYRLCLVLFLLAASVAFAQKVRVESTPGIDFTKYKRYTYRTHPVFEKKPALAERYSTGIQLVKMAVSRNLLKRGFEPTDHEPDFLITFVLMGEQAQDVDVVFADGMYGWGGWYGWPSYYYPSWTETIVSNYINGALMLDFVDAKTDQLIWRAYCTGEINDWSNRDKVVDKAVDKALKRYPPKK